MPFCRRVGTVHSPVAKPKVPGFVGALLFLDVIDSKFGVAVGAVSAEWLALPPIGADERAVIIGPGVSSSSSSVPDHRVVPVAAMSHVLAKMPFTNTGRLVAVLSQYRWKETQLFGIVGCHRVFGDLKTLVCVLQQTR